MTTEQLGIFGATRRGVTPRSILVVGDQTTRGRPFFDTVWQEIWRRCTGEAEAVSVTEPPSGDAGQDIYVEQAESLDRHCDHLPPLLPKPFLAPASHEEAFARRFQECLCRWDVWAVLSAAPSNATERLVKSLVPSGIPLLLAVDSTTMGHRQERLQALGVDFSRSRPPLLQLVADNAQQASAIYAALQGIRSQSNGGNKVWLWAPDDKDPYVNDLGDELLKRGDTPSADLPIDRIVRLDLISIHAIETLAIIYVGYDPERLDQALNEHRRIPFLVADGVRREDSQVSPRPARTLFFEPTVLFEVCAAQAYDACSSVLSTWHVESRTFAEAVRRELTRKKYRFTTEGANTSAGFVPVGLMEAHG